MKINVDCNVAMTSLCMSALQTSQRAGEAAAAAVGLFPPGQAHPKSLLHETLPLRW
jgi:hypothetical protein